MSQTRQYEKNTGTLWLLLQAVCACVYSCRESSKDAGGKKNCHAWRQHSRRLHHHPSPSQLTALYTVYNPVSRSRCAATRILNEKTPQRQDRILFVGIIDTVTSCIKNWWWLFVLVLFCFVFGGRQCSFYNRTECG